METLLKAAAGKDRRAVRAFIWVLLPCLMFISLFIGRFPISPGTLFRILLSRLLPITGDWPKVMETVVFNIRVPRVLLAVGVGGGLAVCGTAFQGVFQNPLISPDIFGVTAGAGFGAALAILLSPSASVIQISAFCWGICAVFITYFLGRIRKSSPTLHLVLAGIITGSIFTALLSLIKYLADPNQKLPAIVFWLMGSLAAVSKKEIITVLPCILLGSAGIFVLRWRINLLSMGDGEARAMGENTNLLKIILIGCGTLITASAVSACGMIGWIGLVIPHVGRIIAGPDHGRLVPFSFALGGGFLLLIDDLSRSMISAEIPIGIFTALIGAPFFAFLLRRTTGTKK